MTIELAIPRARNTDPGSSRDAAVRVRAASSHLCEVVLGCLRRFGPMTTHEIAELTGLTVVTVSPRIKPMRDAGLVVDTGERRDRRSVWEAA